MGSWAECVYMMSDVYMGGESWVGVDLGSGSGGCGDGAGGIMS